MKQGQQNLLEQSHRNQRQGKQRERKKERERDREFEKEGGKTKEINFIPCYGYVGKMEVASEMESVMGIATKVEFEMEVGNEMKS